MGKVVISRSGPPQSTSRGTAPQPGFSDYEDFVLLGRRKDAGSVEIRVYASPAEPMPQAVTVPFKAAEAKKIHASFYSDPTTANLGRALIDQNEAVILGKRLAAALFPEAVFERLAQSLAIVVRRPQGGLRIRLALDESLIDLPWEYVYRPDHMDRDGMSGFLLLDPKISLLREAPNPRMAIEPIDGKQRLHFIGVLWEGKVDGWEVGREFALLQAALKPVANYISPQFAIAGDREAFGKGLERGAAIFHYAGHVDFDPDDRAYLVREMPTSGALRDARKVHIDQLAANLIRSGCRLVVLSACNSGFWHAAKPLLNAGIPALVGVNGAVDSQTTIEFCKKLYESLAVGLTLDEAVSRARLHVMQWGQLLQRFDWGLFMVYMPSPQAVLFPRKASKALAARQTDVRRDHLAIAGGTVETARQLDGMNFGEIMSVLASRRVLILGRFNKQCLKVLEAIKEHLDAHPNGYLAELFTFERPAARGFIEAIIGFAGLSRFIVADLSEPKSIPAELDAIVPRFRSVPVIPVIRQEEEVYATFLDIAREANVVPMSRYRDIKDLLKKLDDELIPRAEAKLAEVRPAA
jgi:hypothetical protein